VQVGDLSIDRPVPGGGGHVRRPVAEGPLGSLGGDEPGERLRLQGLIGGVEADVVQLRIQRDHARADIQRELGLARPAHAAGHHRRHRQQRCASHRSAFPVTLRSVAHRSSTGLPDPRFLLCVFVAWRQEVKR